MKALLRRLFDLWTQRAPLDRTMFSDDFVYDCGSNVISTDEWLRVNEILVPPTDVKLIELRVDNEAGEGFLVFEFFDPVALVHHRVTWSVVFKDGCIARITELDPQTWTEQK